jgi:hypothetical protein
MSRYSNWATGIMTRVFFFFQKERLLSLPSPESDAKLAFINVGVKAVAACVLSTDFGRHIRFSGAWGSVVVKALCYSSEDLGIDPRWCRWGFFPKLPTEPCALGVDSASKNEYQENSWG